MSSENGNGDIREMARRLTESICMPVPPIAVRFTDEIPEGVEKWEGMVPAGCSFWQDAATKIFATVPDDHGICTVGMFTHNLETTPTQDTDCSDSLKVLSELSYVRDQDIPAIPVLKRRFAHVIYGPLASMPLTPDVVLLFGKAAQMLILTEASQQVEGGIPPAMGRPACAVIPQVFNTGKAALSLGCCGARAYVDALTEDISLWALPGAGLKVYVDRIEKLAKANAILTGFHRTRREEVEGGKRPTVKETLAAMPG